MLTNIHVCGSIIQNFEGANIQNGWPLPDYRVLEIRSFRGFLLVADDSYLLAAPFPDLQENITQRILSAAEHGRSPR